MPKPKKTPAAKRGKQKPGKQSKRDYEWRGELVPLAAEFAGCSRSMVYKVLTDKAKSAPVQRAIQQAREHMRRKARQTGRPAA